MNVSFETVTSENASTYISVGIESYKQHYLHLWESKDPTPYISTSFTQAVVMIELQDALVENYIVAYKNNPVGIVKIIKDKAIGKYSAKEALLAEKIYLLQDYAGKGIGKKVLELIEARATDLNKTVVWLDTMQKGRALSFYLKNGFNIIGETEVRKPNVLESEKDMYVLEKQLQVKPNLPV